MSREYDITLFGATGFTGKLVAEALAQSDDVKDGRVRLALAGRNQSKLEGVRASLPADIQKKVAIEVADSKDAAALATLAEKSKVICTTVGPYLRYGQALVAACAEAGTHYCDLTGEPPFIRHSIDLHHERAQQTGARIVHCCGFDSIPSDIGTRMLQEHAIANHGGPCTKVRFYMGRVSGGFSGGTAHSLLEVMEQAKEKEVRRIMSDPYSLVPDGKRGPDKRDRFDVKYDDVVDGWVGPFLMGPVNERVVRRTNHLLDYRYSDTFSYREAMRTGRSFKSRMTASGIKAGLGAVVGMGAFGPTRKLLEKMLPAPGEGPDEAARERGFFEVHIHGWIDDGTHLEAFVRGEKDPGYGETAIMLSQSALCLADTDALDGRDDLSGPGVTTPGAAMGPVLEERLRAQGMTFEMRS